MDNSLKNLIKNYLQSKNISNKYLINFCDSILYSLEEGKRIRAILCLISYMWSNSIVADDIDAEDNIFSLGLAIEAVHAYSLIHDDLPCMDNDEYRRGKLTVWKKFGEDIGVLTGDFLTTLPFIILSDMSIEDNIKLLLIKKFSEINSLGGLIGGQVIDIGSAKNNDKLDFDDLIELHSLKTGKLIQFSLISGYILGGKIDENIMDKLERLGYLIGVAFQIKDDILDFEGDKIKLGKEVQKDKGGFVVNLGIESSRMFLNQYIEDSISIIEELGISELKEIVLYIKNREK